MNRPGSKPGSKAERDALRTEMAAAGAPPGAIAAEMRSRWGIRPREAWRHVHGWSLHQAAELANSSRNASVCLDASLLGKLEKWPGPSSRRPTLPVLVLLADLYGCTADDLLDLDDLRSLPAADLRVLRRSQDSAPAATSAPGPPAPSPERAVDTGLLAAADESSEWAQWAEASNTGDIAVEQMVADLRTLTTEYLSAPPGALFTRARRLRDRVFRLLQGHQTPRQTHDLYLVAGYTCALLAWMTSDLGHPRAADTHGRTAHLCAGLADDSRLQAWVSSTRAKLAFWDGRYLDAAEHARHGASHTAPGTVRLLLACQEADAWAELGAVGNAQRCLTDAEAAAEALTGTDEIGGLFSCTPFRHANYSAAVHLRAGRTDAALRQADSALSEPARHPAHGYGTEAQIRIIRASALLAQGAPDGALEALGPVLALRPEQRLGTLDSRLRQLVATAANGPAAATARTRNLRTAVEAYCREPRPHALSSNAPGGAWITDHDRPSEHG